MSKYTMTELLRIEEFIEDRKNMIAPLLYEIFKEDIRRERMEADKDFSEWMKKEGMTG